MVQEKRFGKRVTMPSTVQIIRELKVLMRHDVELAVAALPAGVVGDDAARTSAAVASQTSPE